MILTLLRFVKKISKIADVSSEFTVVQLFSTLKEFANWGSSSWLKINFLKISLEIKVNCNVLHLCDVAPFYGNYVTENQITTSKLKRFESKRFLYIFLLDFFFAYFRDNKLSCFKIATMTGSLSLKSFSTLLDWPKFYYVTYH